jgi:putative ABC transport system permease protein
MTLRYALRSLRRSPGFVTIAIVALGLGLGLSTTMFAVIDTLLNPVASYRDPSSLVLVAWRSPPRGGSLPVAELARLVSAQARAVGDVTPINRRMVRVADQANVNAANALIVEPSYFRVTGTRLQRGRTFVNGDADVAIVSDQMWRWTFGDRLELAGATLMLDGKPRAVVGVVRAGRTAPEATDIWLPSQAGDTSATTQPLVRLRRGMDYMESLREFAAIGEQLNRQYGSRDAPIGVWSQPIGYFVQKVRETHIAMVGAAVCVLIVACVNLANLMLARGMARRRELALRMAVGASRRSVVMQLFLECAIITGGGVLLGALVSVWGLYVLNHKVPGTIPLIGMLRPVMSWRTFAASALATLIAAIGFGLVPAIRVATGVSLDEPLKDGAGTTSRTTSRYSRLVIVEVALALVLMMAGGLLLRTIHEITSVEYTFDARTLLEGDVFPAPVTDTMRARTLTPLGRRDALLEAARGVPGVRAAAYGRSRMPIGGVLTGEMVGGAPTRTINTQFIDEVSWQYLRVFGLAITKGRDFEPGDETGQGVAIVNPVAALRLYPNGDAVGHMIKLGGPDRVAPWVPIVGIARSPMALRSGEEPVGPMVWVVHADTTLKFGGTLIVRAAGNDPSVASRVRTSVNANAAFRAMSFTPYAARRDAEVASRVFLAKAFVTMGMVALFLAAVGLYGMLSHAVSQRMREFAVRAALGAQRSQLFRMVMHDAAVVILGGTGIGAFAALAASRLIDSMLTNVLPSDVLTLVLCEIVLMTAGFAAAFGPAHRAIRANPLDILRAV